MNVNIKMQITLILMCCCLVVVEAQKTMKLVILHTNDTHSQVEPTEKSGLKTADMGGYARRMGVIQQIRKQEQDVLLLDAGDFSQGTPYFNFYNGRIEVDALNRMRYDAVTLGNHEFDNGIDTLASILRSAHFPVLTSNYDVEHTSLRELTKPYVVIQKHGVRIGIMALNVDPRSLIIESNYKGLLYQNPQQRADEIATILRKKEKCQIVICLSHLGADTKMEVNDFEIARNSHDIDVIIGGHSHSMITDTKVPNADGKPVIVAQMGKSGLYLGRIDLEFEKK